MIKIDFENINDDIVYKLFEVEGKEAEALNDIYLELFELIDRDGMLKLFKHWKIAVNLENSSAVVSGYNDTELIITQAIPYTDFPLSELKLYLIDGVILLPSEY